MPKMRELRPRLSRVLGVSLVLLSVLLMACGGGGGGGGGGSGGGKSATPTPGARARATATPTATAATRAGFTTYRGSSFTLEYPSSWQATTAPDGAVFSDTAEDFRVSILTAPNPEGVTSPHAALQVNLEVFAKSGLYKNFKQINVPATTVVGGVTWQQMAATGDTTSSSPTTIKIVLLATNHPDSSPQTQLFTIDIQGPLARYDEIYNSAIGPMLQSFRFLS